MIYRSIVIASCLLIVSCGSKSTETSTTPAAEDAFVGTWETACTNVAGAGSIKGTQIFSSDKTVKNEIVSYSDANCTNKTIQQSFSYTFSVTGDGEQSSKAVQYTLVSVKLTNHDDTSVAAANSFKSCGIETWQKGITTDCTDKPINSLSSAELNAAYSKGFKSTSYLKIEGAKFTNIASPDTVFTKK